MFVLKNSVCSFSKKITTFPLIIIQIYSTTADTGQVISLLEITFDNSDAASKPWDFEDGSY